MLWAALLTGHLIGLVGYTLLLRRSALATVNKYALAAMSQTAIFLPSIIFLFTGSLTLDFNLKEVIGLLGSSAFLVGLHIFIIKALQQVEASLFTIIFNLRLFFTTILGYIFLSEIPPALQITGGTIIFLSILMLGLHKNRQYRSAPILFALFATLWMSFHAVLEKHNVNAIGFEDYMFYAGLISSTVLWLIAFSKKTSVAHIKHHLDKPSLALFSFRTLSAWGYVYSLLYGSLAVTNYVSGLSVVLIVLFGILLLGERNNIPQKLQAVGIALIGLTLILVSRL